VDIPYPNEFSCRLRDPGSLRIVGSKERTHEGKTYRVIFGIPKSGGGSVEQAYRYPKSSWTRDQAAAHCQVHDGRFEAAFDGTGLELVYVASVHSIETGDEQHLATFYLMNTTRNRNKWGVTDRALEQALPTLLKRPIGIGPGYKTDRHYQDPLKTGTFIKVDKPDGYALGTVEVTNPQVWAMLTDGELGPISVVILSYREVCSECGEVLSGAEDPFKHECIAKSDAFILVESFKFDRVDFISVPAYPQAGLLNMAADSIRAEIPLELLAGFYTSQSSDHFKGRGAGSPGHSPKTRITRRKNAKMENMTLEEAVAKVEELKGSVEALTKERDDLKAQLTNPEKNPALKAMQDELAAMTKRIHDDLVDAAVEARFKAGLVEKKEDEKARIYGFRDELLAVLIEDAGKVAAKLEASGPKGPKARYGKPGADSLSAAVEDQRERLFGYRRDAKGQVIV
jgi:hypothetical protein